MGSLPLYYVFPIGGLFWYEISAFSHQNPCSQALFKLFSTKCLTIDFSPTIRVVARALWAPGYSRYFPYFQQMTAVVPVISLMFRNNSHFCYQNNPPIGNT